MNGTYVSILVTFTLVGCSLLWWTRCRAKHILQNSPATDDATTSAQSPKSFEDKDVPPSPASTHGNLVAPGIGPEDKKHPSEMDDDTALSPRSNCSYEGTTVPPSPKPIQGYLVASSEAPEDFGGFIREDKEAPSSTDEEEDLKEEDSFVLSNVDRQKMFREGSFRRRTNDKIVRAKALQINSKSLTSHLVTPAQHNRRLADGAFAIANKVQPLPAGFKIPENPSSQKKKTEDPSSNKPEMSFKRRKSSLKNISSLDSLSAIAQSRRKEN